jgi:hypothetical protein
VAALWLICQGVAFAAVPGRLACSHAESMSSKSEHDEHACCKDGKICPIHKHRKDVDHSSSHHAHHPAPSPPARDTVPSAPAGDTVPSSDRVMRSGCAPEQPAVAPLLLVPGVIPSLTTVADDLGLQHEIAALHPHALARVSSPDIPPPR